MELGLEGACTKRVQKRAMFEYECMLKDVCRIWRKLFELIFRVLSLRSSLSPTSKSAKNEELVGPTISGVEQTPEGYWPGVVFGLRGPAAAAGGSFSFSAQRSYGSTASPWPSQKSEVLQWTHQEGREKEVFVRTSWVWEGWKPLEAIEHLVRRGGHRNLHKPGIWQRHID